MLLHEKQRPLKWGQGIHPQLPGDCDHPNADEFASYKRWTGFRPLRKSPRILGLALVKRAIIGGYRWRILSLCFTQRLIDLSRSWEA